MQPPLGLKQFKAGAEEAAVLVAVGIAQHDFLPAAVIAHGPFHHAGGQEFRHDFGAGAQVVDGFEERHDAQPAAFAAGIVAEQAAVFGEQIKPQHIGGGARHGKNEGADGLRIGAIQGFADEIEEIEKFAGFLGHTEEIGQEAQRLVELANNPGGPFRAAFLGNGCLRQRIHLVPDFLQHPVGDRGVLADVEAHGAEAEYFRFPAHGAHKGCGKAHGLHFNERLLRGGKFGDELGHIAKRRCSRHFLQAGPQGTEELAEGFLRDCAA